MTTTVPWIEINHLVNQSVSSEDKYVNTRLSLRGRLRRAEQAALFLRNHGSEGSLLRLFNQLIEYYSFPIGYVSVEWNFADRAD